LRWRGLKIIEFFGISLASFQVGGGLLLMMSALADAEPRNRPRRAATTCTRAATKADNRRQHRDRPADHPAADRPGGDLDDDHLRRQDQALVGARRARSSMG